MAMKVIQRHHPYVEAPTYALIGEAASQAVQAQVPLDDKIVNAKKYDEIDAASAKNEGDPATTPADEDWGTQMRRALLAGTAPRVPDHMRERVPKEVEIEWCYYYSRVPAHAVIGEIPPQPMEVQVRLDDGIVETKKYDEIDTASAERDCEAGTPLVNKVVRLFSLTHDLAADLDPPLTDRTNDMELGLRGHYWHTAPFEWGVYHVFLDHMVMFECDLARIISDEWSIAKRVVERLLNERVVGRDFTWWGRQQSGLLQKLHDLAPQISGFSQNPLEAAIQEYRAYQLKPADCQVINLQSQSRAHDTGAIGGIAWSPVEIVVGLHQEAQASRYREQAQHRYGQSLQADNMLVFVDHDQKRIEPHSDDSTFPGYGIFQRAPGLFSSTDVRQSRARNIMNLLAIEAVLSFGEIKGWKHAGGPVLRRPSPSRGRRGATPRNVGRRRCIRGVGGIPDTVPAAALAYAYDDDNRLMRMPSAKNRAQARRAVPRGKNKPVMVVTNNGTNSIVRVISDVRLPGSSIPQLPGMKKAAKKDAHGARKTGVATPILDVTIF